MEHKWILIVPIPMKHDNDTINHNPETWKWTLANALNSCGLIVHRTKILWKRTQILNGDTMAVP